MTRRTQPDGVCSCCGRVGVVWADVEWSEAGYVTCTDPDTPPLCDRCDYAQRRYEAAQGTHYPYGEPPPKTPPVRR